MDKSMTELVAMGAAAAADRHSCTVHHLAKYNVSEIPREEVVEPNPVFSVLRGSI